MKLICVLVIMGLSNCLADICDVCSCKLSNNSIYCQGHNTEDFRISADMVKGVPSTKFITLQHYNYINIQRNAFSELNDLFMIEILDSNSLHVAMGVFSTLNTLIISNVRNVDFSNVALMGASDVRKIVMTNSTVDTLNSFSLYDLNGLDEFRLSNVSLRKVQKQSLKIMAKSIVVENCTITHVEKLGIQLHSPKILFRTTNFYDLQPNSTFITSQYQTKFLQNRFFSKEFNINIQSPFVEFFQNHLPNITTSDLQFVQKSMFMKNFIEAMDLDDVQSIFYYKDFYNNTMNCRCGVAGLSNVELMQRNYCKASCSLSWQTFYLATIQDCRTNRIIIDVDSICLSNRNIFNIVERNRTDKSIVNVLETSTRASRTIYQPNSSTSVRCFCLFSFISVLLSFFY